MSLLVQDFLLTHSFAELYEQHGVAARPSADGSKWSLNYDQLAAKTSDRLANQCRGLILRPITTVINEASVVGQTSVVARPMNRFLNSGETYAAEIDWNDPTVRIQEKLDGTCIILYFDDVKNHWCVATRAVSEADVIFGQDIVSPLPQNTFYELFKYAAVETIRTYSVGWNSVPADQVFSAWTDNLLRKDLTYIYELTSPLNRVVVKYDDYRVTLLAARVTQTGEYVEHPLGYGPALLKPQEWPLKSLADLVEFVNASNPAKIEGAVVIDGKYNRLKVKSKAWVLASRSKDVVTTSKRNALQSIIDGTIDDVLPLLDKPVAEYIEKMRAELIDLLSGIDSLFSVLKDQPDRKSFALAVQASGMWQTPLFNLYGSQKYTRTIEWLQAISKSGKLTDTTLDTVLGLINA